MPCSNPDSIDTRDFRVTLNDTVVEIGSVVDILILC
jgi:hypothetical protein